MPARGGSGPGSPPGARVMDGGSWHVATVGSGFWQLPSSVVPACPHLWFLLVQSLPCSLPADKVGAPAPALGGFVVWMSLGRNERMSPVTVP